MSVPNIPECPPSLKSIQHYLKTASEHDARDIVVSYWCRLYALQTGLKIDKSSPEAKKLLLALMDWLEKTKTQEKDNEAIVHDIPAQAHLEMYALKLFLWADSQDRASIFNKNVVKAFYTSGMIYDVLETFGELTEEVQQNRKYAKWKAAYIHNCLKNGETPVPGPMLSEGDNELGFTMPPQPQDTQPESPAPPPPNNNGSATKDDTIALPSPPEVSNPEPMCPPVSYGMPSPTSQTSIQRTPEEIAKAQKYCKFAGSALNYDDVGTAISYLQKALNLLSTGIEE